MTKREARMGNIGGVGEGNLCDNWLSLGLGPNRLLLRGIVVVGLALVREVPVHSRIPGPLSVAA